MWDRGTETMARDRLEKLQLARLKAMLERAYKRVPFYKRALDRGSLKPGRINSLNDLATLPFTTKQDLRDHYRV